MYSRYMEGKGREGMPSGLLTLSQHYVALSKTFKQKMALFFSQITWDVALRLCFKCWNIK
jgi:hypothetical protein